MATVEAKSHLAVPLSACVQSLLVLYDDLDDSSMKRRYMTKNKPERQQESQSRAFKKTARELEVDESEEAFDKALGKIGRPSAPTFASKVKTKART